MKKASELCEKCKPIYDSWSDVSPETARAIKRQGITMPLYDFFRRQQDAVRESCTVNHHEEGQ